MDVKPEDEFDFVQAAEMRLIETGLTVNQETGHGTMDVRTVMVRYPFQIGMEFGLCDGCAWDGVMCHYEDEELDRVAVFKCEIRERLKGIHR